jgi:hypothetical protein
VPPRPLNRRLNLPDDTRPTRPSIVDISASAGQQPEARLRRYAASFTPPNVPAFAPEDTKYHQTEYDTLKAFNQYCKLVMKYEKGNSMGDFVAFLVKDARSNGYGTEAHLWQLVSHAFPSGSTAAKIMNDSRIRNYTFDQAVQYLLAEYRARPQEVIARLTTTEFRQGPNESVATYFARVGALFQKYHVREADMDSSMLSILIQNLYHPELRMHISVQKAKSIAFSWFDFRSFALDMDATISVARAATVIQTPRTRRWGRDGDAPRANSQEPPTANAADRARTGNTVRFRDQQRNRPSTPRHAQSSQSPSRSREADSKSRPASRTPSADANPRHVACVDNASDDENTLFV